jgi:hypothetical protein
MPLESATFVNQLDQTRPTATDVKSEGDDVMRLIKSTLKNSFPNVGGAMNASQTELNRLVGATEDVQPRLSATLSAPNGETLNRLPAAASRLGGYLTFNASTGQPEVGFSLATASANSLGIFGSGGNVGIGGTPSAALHVQRTSANSEVRISTFTSGSPVLRLNAEGVNGGSITYDRASTTLILESGGVNAIRIDASGNAITNVNTAAPTLSTNQQMVFALTSNTNLRISVRGTDGTTRVANITLA